MPGRRKSKHQPRKRVFPDPRTAYPDGLLAFSTEIDAKLLLEAYSIGVFPWPQDGSPILWFSPPERGVLDFKEVHIPRSFRKFMKKTTFELRIDTAFREVITACARQARPGQDGTWITSDIISAYDEFHKLGYAHSIEAWHGADLVGGLYGVYVNSVFCGESMFHTQTGASKFCLYHTIRILSAAGHEWMDIQMVTSLLGAWGGKLIPRDEYLGRLAKAASRSPANPFEHIGA